MTLIQTVISRDFVIQVADRRLTRPGGSVFDDSYTKLVCWNQSFTVGFTGLARLDRRQQKSTSEWIAEILSDCPVFVYGVNLLRTELEAEIRRLPDNFDKRLAIVVAGFESTVGPYRAEIANFDTATGRTGDQNTVRLSTYSLEGREFASHSAGATLDDTQRSVLDRYVPRIVGQPHGINRAIRVIVENQRRVAMTEPTVGSDALCVFIPRQRTAPQMVTSNLGGPDLSTTNSSFGFFDAGGFQFRQFGPLLAHDGFVQDQVEASADPQNPDNQVVGARWLKLPHSWSQESH